MARERDVEAELFEGIVTRTTAAFSPARADSRVWLWDVGPEKPIQPKKPAHPKGKEGDPEYEAAMVDFRAELEDYEEAMKRHKTAKKQYADFERRFGGPIEQKFWSVDARDALVNDALACGMEISGHSRREPTQTRRRWFISSKTTGYENLPNGGLPTAMTPGHGHEENLRRQREGEEISNRDRRADPVFGSVEAA